MRDVPIKRGHDDAAKYHCGTLAYTKVGLLAVCTWLLWGNFCLTLMEAVVPTVLPLKLKALGCPNWGMGVILATIPGLLNMTICPYVSFKSDRYRGKWGRRLPFIMGTLPFLCISLLLIGYTDSISLFLQQHIASMKSVAPATLVMLLLGLFMVVFQFFNMFVASVFYYLLNDVVPVQFLARFLSAFSVVGTIASGLYNYFVFTYAESHMREIFIGAALLYFIGFGLLCLNVKEGSYPPADDTDGRGRRGLEVIRTYFRECFTHKIYLVMFATNSFLATATVIYTFDIFFKREMGLTLDDIGKLGAIGGAISLIALYVAGVFVDRWHPLRVLVTLRLLAVIGFASSWVWLFVTLPGKYYFWLAMGTVVAGSFQYAFSGASEYPAMMRIFPRSRFGQFCSAQSLMQSSLRLITGIAAGLFVDALKWVCHGSDFAYRFNFLWTTVFGIIGAGLMAWLYVIWHQLGGDFNYHPPASWSPSKREEMESAPTLPPQSRWLEYALHLFTVIMSLSVLALPALMWWMYRQHANLAFKWYAMVIVPLSVVVWVGWRILAGNIRRDMESSMTGKPLRNGIPHHGVLMVGSIKYVALIALWVVQVVVTVNLKMEVGAIVFGVANVVTNFLLLGVVWMNCRIERGYSVSLDTWPGNASTTREKGTEGI